MRLLLNILGLLVTLDSLVSAVKRMFNRQVTAIASGAAKVDPAVTSGKPYSETKLGKEEHALRSVGLPMGNPPVNFSDCHTCNALAERALAERLEQEAEAAKKMPHMDRSLDDE